MSRKGCLLPIDAIARASLFINIVGLQIPKDSRAEPAPATKSEKSDKETRPMATPEQQKEIKKLIEQLGDKDFSIREKASARFVEIGLPALPQLRGALRINEPEIRKRSQLAIDEIEKRNNFKTVNGVEFSVVTDKVWKIPKRGEQTKIKLALSFSNRRNEKLNLYLFDTIWISLVSPKLGEMRIEGGRNGPGRQFPSRTLRPGEAFVHTYPDAKLSWVGQDLRLVYVDRAPKEYYCIPKLSAGKHSLSFTYEQKWDIRPKDGSTPWKGGATTYPVEVEIK